MTIREETEGVRHPTGTRVTRAIGVATIIGLAWFVLFGAS